MMPASMAARWGMEARTMLSVSAAAVHHKVAAGIEKVTPLSPAAPGLPLGTNFDLASRWVSIPTSFLPTGVGITQVAMSSDSTVWAAGRSNNGQGMLYEYDPHGGVWYQVWTTPTQIISISAEAAIGSR